MTNLNPRFIVLEDSIPYDWDDYGLWGAVLYEIATNKVFTTKYGHGDDMKERSESVELSEAIENGIISVETLLKGVLDNFPLRIDEALESAARCASLDSPVAIPVTVTRGRKFKGDGYLIYAVAEPVRYGLGAYRGEKNYHPVIVNPSDLSINKVNSFGYLEYNIDRDAVRENIYNNIGHNVTIIQKLAHWWAYNMSYSACDTDNANALSKKITLRGLCFDIPEVVTEAIEKETARIVAENEAKMNEKLPPIIEWVKNNTDKTTEAEILELAKHIYHKYNK